ncbi:MAG: hypothetical protein PHC88_09535 [Terrimicrobiaceae bacterium]|nr:hypothetical protein [Terrimicrobiaceae bacterium]
MILRTVVLLGVLIGALAANSARALDTTFISSQDNTLDGAGAWWTQGFTLRGTVRFRFRFACDYRAQCAVVSAASINAFRNNGTFNGYGIFDGQFGTKGVTLGPGTYYVGVRNATAGANEFSVELDYDRVPSGYRYFGRAAGGVASVPAHGKFYQSFRLLSPTAYTYYLDGCNSGGMETFLIPAAELGNFLGDLTFRYYTAYYSATGEAPGQWNVRLGKGRYFLVFRNSSDIPKSVTYELLAYKRIGR